MGDPVLRAEADAVDEVDDELRALIDDMFETMYDADGVGLAAPQIGIGRRLIVIDPHEPEVAPFALINPATTNVEHYMCQWALFGATWASARTSRR